MQDMSKVGEGGGLKDIKVGKLGEAELTKLEEANLPGKQRNTAEGLCTWVSHVKLHGAVVYSSNENYK